MASEVGAAMAMCSIGRRWRTRIGGERDDGTIPGAEVGTLLGSMERRIIMEDEEVVVLGLDGGELKDNQVVQCAALI
jgi:hypothetical protein